MPFSGGMVPLALGNPIAASVMQAIEFGCGCARSAGTSGSASTARSCATACSARLRRRCGRCSASRSARRSSSSPRSRHRPARCRRRSVRRRAPSAAQTAPSPGTESLMSMLIVPVNGLLTSSPFFAEPSDRFRRWGDPRQPPPQPNAADHRTPPGTPRTSHHGRAKSAKLPVWPAARSPSVVGSSTRRHRPWVVQLVGRWLCLPYGVRGRVSGCWTRLGTVHILPAAPHGTTDQMSPIPCSRP